MSVDSTRPCMAVPWLACALASECSVGGLSAGDETTRSSSSELREGRRDAASERHGRISRCQPAASRPNSLMMKMIKWFHTLHDSYATQFRDARVPDTQTQRHGLLAMHHHHMDSVRDFPPPFLAPTVAFRTHRTSTHQPAMYGGGFDDGAGGGGQFGGDAQFGGGGGQVRASRPHTSARLQLTLRPDVPGVWQLQLWWRRVRRRQHVSRRGVCR